MNTSLKGTAWFGNLLTEMSQFKTEARLSSDLDPEPNVLVLRRRRGRILLKLPWSRNDEVALVRFFL